MKRKLLFLVILISILPLSLIFADEERLFTLGGKNGWNSVYDRRNVTSTSGRYGYEALEIENASTIFDSDTDLLLDFETVSTKDVSGNYNIIYDFS